METCERLVEFPSWEEYEEGLNSSVADIKNIGPPEAGTITAGKFLERFIDYHSPRYSRPGILEKRDSYRGQGGSGVGVRLLFDFIRNQVKQQAQ